MLETLDYTIRIGSTPTFLYFDLYLRSAYAAHFVYCEESYLVSKCEKCSKKRKYMYEENATPASAAFKQSVRNIQ